MTEKKLHPWDHTIAGYATVHASGLRFEPHDTEEAAWEAARKGCSSGDYIWSVFGPGLRNRLGAVMNGERMTQEEFAKARTFKGNDASMSEPVGW